MDKLYNAAKFYQDNLEGHKFHLKAGKNKKEIEFDIVFGVDNFKHLLGLNKLTDIQIGRLGSEVGYLQILNGQITINDIQKSAFYKLMEARLDNFKEIKSVLFGKELMVKSLHGTFNLIRADFMLTERNDKFGYAHLFLKGKEVTIPVTYIINTDNYYLRNNPNKWTVLSIEDISNKN